MSQIVKLKTTSTRFWVTIFALCLGSILLGCASTNKEPSTKPVEKSSQFQRLIPIFDERDLELFKLSQPVELQSQKYLVLERSLAVECGVVKSDEEVAGIAAVVLGSLLSAGVKLSLDSIDKKLKAELKEYSAEYSASYWLDAFQSSQLKCVRFIRGTVNPQGEQVDLDLILKLSEVPPTHLSNPDRTITTQGIRVLPKRIFYSNPAPKNDSVNGKYGLAASFAATHVSNEKSQSESATLILKDDFTIKPDEKFIIRYYPKPVHEYCRDDAKSANHPAFCLGSTSGLIIAWPLISEIDVGPSTKIEIEIAETGAPSNSLELLANLFAEAKKDMGDGLSDLASKKLGID